ncbi:efflux RND transporter permease subunit [Woeseia oceani]|uniref:Multidrug transporter AcrB n=1 Tax=Woeseia oceani TaxID=1548547 RepID=A0A193LDM4_9GAMM|nr:efflux RND transporter permease subunit [Woeseia oceani]ANO50484.1 multidrug transporter AcrB [Woeseia oceani]
MVLSDLSVTRPVFASVLSLLLIAFGLMSYSKLSMREYPDIDPPVVSIDTSYAGAAANVVETRITEAIEDRISGVEGIKYVSSTSSDGRSRINIEFDIGRNIEDAANDIRDRVSGIVDNLPEEADPPDIQKADSSDDVILWMNLVNENMDLLELTDYAKRNLQDRFSVIPGVARVRIGGGLEYSMRVWVDRNKLAARGLTVQDIEVALRTENVELPAGGIESEKVQFTARVERGYRTPEDFKNLVIAKRADYLVRLGDVARVEREAVETRTLFRGNGAPMVGLGIIKQSKGNTVEVAQSAIELAARLGPNLPPGMEIIPAYDTSVFIRGAIAEVYKTLAIAMILVVSVIYLFLGSWRAMLVPAVTVPVSLVSTFIVLNLAGFSINLLTLLALVLAIGLVVDDAIVVLENIYRRIEEGEPPLSAAFHGTRQVGFAVIATTIVLVAVFVPITFLEGDLGRLFSEFAITMAAAVSFSTFVAVTLCAMIASKVLRKAEKSRFHNQVDRLFDRFSSAYGRALTWALRRKSIVIAGFAGVAGLSFFLFNALPSEYAPKEDRGAFFLMINAPEGSSFEFTKEYMEEVEQRLMPYVDAGELNRVLVRAPRNFGNSTTFNDGIVISVMNDWASRRPADEVMAEISQKMADLPGVRAFPVMRQGFGGGTRKPVQFVLGGGTYEELAQWRDLLIEKIEEDNPGLTDIDSDFKETKPQLKISINKNRAGDLGVSSQVIGTTLESMLGSRRVTTYIDNGEEYDVILEGERDSQRTPTNMQNIYVRSDTGALIPLSNLVNITEFADSGDLNRYNRVRAITLEAGLADGYVLGDALDHLRELVRLHLPGDVTIDYKGQSLDYQTSGSSLMFVFMLGFVIVFLVLAAQFESYIHPLVIILTVPLAMTGALTGLFITGNSLNVYTQIGLIMLIGLAAKNGILIVEFVNQLRDQGIEFGEALIKAAQIRLRPILMTGITTIAGSLPLILSTGAGAESRVAIGVVILFGVASATVFTVFIVPVAYDLLARNTGSPSDVKRELEMQDKNRQAGVPA